MQGDQSEREQDPLYGSGGEQPPPHGPASQQPPVPPAVDPTSPYPAGTGQPGQETGGQQTDAIWFGSQQPPGYGTADQPPPYQGNWQPPDVGWPPQPGPGGPSAAAAGPSRRRGRRILSFAIVAILGVAIGAAAAFGVAHNTPRQPSSTSTGGVPTPGSGQAPVQNTENSKINVAAIAKAITPSVANITSKLQYENATAEGTGIVISSSGLVLTNNHVIYRSTKVTADVGGTGRTYTARVVGTDKNNDVALLQLQGVSGLTAAPIGDASKVALGDPVVAIGNLGGQGGEPTVTRGTITALNRTITAGDQGGGNTETLHGVLQTDAAIGSGDSGGPLVNASGQVIGMDTAAATNNIGGSEHIGFAIRINNALAIARQIAAGHGSSTIQIGLPAFLGVSVCPSISQAAQCMAANGLSNGAFGNTSIAPVSSGALVQNALPGTPAQAVGLSPGDVITGLGGRRITSADSLTSAMRTHRPGDTVSVMWVDTNGQRHTATVTLTRGPAA